VIAQSAALNEADEWLDNLLDELRARQDLLVQLLPERVPDARYLPGDATYLAWLDLRTLDLESPVNTPRGEIGKESGPAAYFLEHARVALSDGAAFGSGGSGHVRLNFATSEEILREALDRLGRSLAVDG